MFNALDSLDANQDFSGGSAPGPSASFGADPWDNAPKQSDPWDNAPKKSAPAPIDTSDPWGAPAASSYGGGW